jgi:CRP/FNR family cyclic AMP-dependent transcriptional regulator
MQESATRTQYYSKCPIFREGDEGDVMYVIKSGRVRVTKNMYGIMVTIAELGPGDYFGEMALLEGTPRSAFALADTPVGVEVYDRAALAEHIADNPEFALSLLRTMSHRLRRIDDRLTDLVARGRLGRDEAMRLSPHGQGVAAAK